MINLKLVFRSLTSRCHGNQFFLDFIHTELMDVARRRRLVAQPGGLTMSFVLHLVDITTDNVLIIDIKD